MISNRTFSALLCLVLLPSCAPAQARAPVTPAEILTRVADAHGGADRWRSVRTISYEHELEFDAADKPWRSREVVDERHPRRRLYQDWPSHGGSLTWDGRDVWTVDWKLDNPPRVMPFLTHHSLIAPFLGLDDRAQLEGPGRGRLPGREDELVTVTIRFPVDRSQPPTATYYKLFIDPDTWQVAGVSYAVGFGRLLDLMDLPPEIREFGPLTHVFESLTTVNGFRLPVRYWTQSPKGGVAGRHVVVHWAIDVPFDEQRMLRPPGAVVDESSHERRVR